MQFDKYQHRRFSRRQLMQYASLSGMGLFLGSCGNSESRVSPVFNPLNQQSGNVRALFEPLNQSIEELIFKAKNPEGSLRIFFKVKKNLIFYKLTNILFFSRIHL